MMSTAQRAQRLPRALLAVAGLALLGLSGCADLTRPDPITISAEPLEAPKMEAAAPVAAPKPATAAPGLPAPAGTG
jgi:hypothetical protein